MRPRDLKQRQPHSGRWAANEVADGVANKKQKLPAEIPKGESFRLSACGLFSTALGNGPSFPTQLTKRAFTAKHLSIGSSAARPATTDTTSSGMGRRRDFTNTANQRWARVMIKRVAPVAAMAEYAMGGVIYKTDQSLVDRGFRGPDAYLRDENGIPVVETIRNPNGKMLRFLLEWLRPEKWGKHRKIDVPQTGGVLVVGGIPHDIPNKVNNGTAASVKARKWKAGLRMLQETEV